MKAYDAVVVGSGPNGLSAAIVFAQAGLSVLLIEGMDTIGGGMRSAELTLPGFHHDQCAAIFPLGIASPFFKSLPLHLHGLSWIQPAAPLAHPFVDGTAVLLERSLEETCRSLGADGKAYRQLLEPFVENSEGLVKDILAPLHMPSHPLQMARFGYYGLRSAQSLAYRQFCGERARSLFAGLAAHAVMPLDQPLTAAFGLLLGFLGHAAGWPLPQGGSQKLADALGSYFKSLRGEVVTNVMIESLEELPPHRVALLDVTPKQLLNITGDALPSSYQQKLSKYRYGPGVFKMDWALSNPIPWRSAECLKAGTVHLGGTFEQIANAERLVWEGRIPSDPYILVAQPTLFDPERAPAGKHIAWAYCHVPSGSDIDISHQLEKQIDKYAPGFIDCILARSVKTPSAMERYNPNYIGGDITGGVEDLYQLFTRPAARLNPYSTPLKNLYICSSSTPPGGGVHGMCGYYAARSALKSL